jgi:hypothetical protein
VPFGDQRIDLKKLKAKLNDFGSKEKSEKKEANLGDIDESLIGTDEGRIGVVEIDQITKSNSQEI